MKLLQLFLKKISGISFLAAALLLAGSMSYAQELPDKPQSFYNDLQSLNVNNFGPVMKDTKKSDRPMADIIVSKTDFVIFDSLANLFSYYSDDQQPYVYYPSMNKLMTIKRGHQYGNEEGQDYSLNNLFVRISDDNGERWGDPIMVYDHTDFDDNKGRYPSIYPFMFGEEFSFFFTAPVTDGDGWNGVINGVYVEGAPTVWTDEELDYNGVDYTWGTGAKLLAMETGDEEAYAIAVSSVFPVNQGDFTNNNNFAYRKLDNFAEWVGVIPEQWNSSLFYLASEDSRFNTLIDMEYGPDESIYFGIMGGFQATKDEDSAKTVAFSFSNDRGETWSDFDICPFSLIREYAERNGLKKDSVWTSWDSQDMVVFDNGDVSFGVFMGDYTEGSGSNQQFIEVYKVDGEWGVRKIADREGGYFLYQDSDDTQDNTNQMPYEFQMTKTVDGSKLVAKWTQGFDTEIDGEVWEKWNYEIMVCAREKDMDDWGKVVNITDNEQVDRTSWIPNLLPNDLTSVPIIKLESMPVESDETDQEKLMTQISSEIPQYVLIGHANVMASLDVEEESNPDLAIQDLSVYPNPVLDRAEINFYLTENTNLEAGLYDMTGRLVEKIHSGYLSAGLRSLTVSTKDLSNGAYYCRLNYNNKNISKMIIVTH